MPIHMLEELEDKLFLLQRRLNVYANEIVVEQEKSHRLENNLFQSPSEGMYKLGGGIGVLIRKPLPYSLRYVYAGVGGWDGECL